MESDATRYKLASNSSTNKIFDMIMSDISHILKSIIIIKCDKANHKDSWLGDANNSAVIWNTGHYYPAASTLTRLSMMSLIKSKRLDNHTAHLTRQNGRSQLRV